MLKLNVAIPKTWSQAVDARRHLTGGQLVVLYRPSMSVALYCLGRFNLIDSRRDL